MLMRSLSLSALAAAAILPFGCTTNIGAKPPTVDGGIEVARTEDDGDPIPEDKVLFACKPGKLAPHPQLQILKVELTPEEVEPDEQEVVIEINHVEAGIAGTCRHRPFEDDPNSVRFACVSSNDRLRIYWPVDAATAGKLPTSSAPVEIREAWLFWTKSYTATCEPKAL